MSDFWTVLGLLSIDGKFVAMLDAVKSDPKRLTDVTRQNAFRLSRYELAELQHILQTKKVMDLYAEIRACWTRPDCDAGYIYSDKYSHLPKLVRDDDLKSILEAQRVNDSDGDIKYLKDAVRGEQTRRARATLEELLPDKNLSDLTDEAVNGLASRLDEARRSSGGD